MGFNTVIVHVSFAVQDIRDTEMKPGMKSPDASEDN
jgi:hypothetical protein